MLRCIRRWALIVLHARAKLFHKLTNLLLCVRNVVFMKNVVFLEKMSFFSERMSFFLKECCSFLKNCFFYQYFISFCFSSFNKD